MILFMQTIAQIQNLIWCIFKTPIYANDCTGGEILQKATIKDVAKTHKKYRLSTVSRVLSGNPSISDDTCKRVKKKKELHYTPNTTARSLRCEKKQKV